MKAPHPNKDSWPFSARITELRVLKGFAKKGVLGISASYMQKIENEGLIPSDLEIVKLVQVLGDNKPGLATELIELANTQRNLKKKLIADKTLVIQPKPVTTDDCVPSQLKAQKKIGGQNKSTDATALLKSPDLNQTTHRSGKSVATNYCSSSGDLRLGETFQSLPKILVPNNLLRQELVLVRRDDEIEKILQVLAKSNQFCLVSITGVGGVGKTALALEVAHRCLNLRGLPQHLDPTEFAFDAIVWTSAKKIKLDGESVRLRFSVKSNLASIVREILKVAAPAKMGALPPEERQMELAMELLREKRILLVVDNMETVDDEEVLGFLYEVPTSSKVIITDRRAVHESWSLPLTELSTPDAEFLIREQCRSHISRDRLNLNDDQIKSLAEHTGGIPLAINWALGRIVATDADPATVIRRLADAGQTPVLGFLFDESYRLISPNSKKLLAALALPDTPVVGEMLGNWLNLGRNDVEDALDQLKEFALIKVHRPANNDRHNRDSLPTIQKSYRILSLAREFVRSRKIEPDESCRKTISEKLFSIVDGQEEKIDCPSIVTIDLIDEHHELLAWGVEDAFNFRQHQLVVQMVRGLGHALGIRGYNDLRRRLGEMAVHSAKAIGSKREIARALITNVAEVYFFWSDYDKCLAALKEGLVAARAEDDQILIGMGLRLTAQVAMERKNLGGVKKSFQEVIKEFINANDSFLTYDTWESCLRRGFPPKKIS
jgi:hypothetical protein